jgi:hypothetical protein
MLRTSCSSATGLGLAPDRIEANAGVVLGEIVGRGDAAADCLVDALDLGDV